MTINLIDLAWAAGFLEGEGSFYSTHKGKYKKTNGEYSWKSGHLCLTADQVNKEPLEKLQRLFGGSLRYYPRKDGHFIWKWGLYGAQARGLVMTLYTFMSQRRREQIEKALTIWKSTPSPGGDRR